MKIHCRILILSPLLLLLSSCFKEDKPLTLPQTESEVMSVYMGDAYQNQLFFKLEDLTYSKKDLNDWDLAFDNITNQFKVVSNYGRNIFVARTNIHNRNELNTIKPAQIPLKQWLYDFPNGSIDSNAFGDWTKLYGNNMPYHILDMGRNLSAAQRYYFIKVLEADETHYKVELGKLSSPDSAQTIDFARNKDRNFTYLNIRNGQIATDYEPDNNEWDFVFTRYRFIFYIDPNPTEPFPYLVTGCLLNPHNVSVSIDTVIGYDKINLAVCQHKDYTTRQDIIGYAWKTFDYTVSFDYTMNPNTVYIVKNTKGDYYKLRFLDFYNENKQTGYPKFEVERVVK
ncbi:MAG: HmuY family protein [Bacteroidia bacterium]|nr:HmuY family protein [Bacteroidia bacterium]MCO5252772.1 HmuY family protein [Bacteroidota bacterium]